MNTIAPCPACGSPADMWGSEPGAWVGCENARCALCGPIKDSKPQAITAWNRLSAAATMAAAARAWLAEMERAVPLPDATEVVGGVTIGMIRATGGGV